MLNKHKINKLQKQQLNKVASLFKKVSNITNNDNWNDITSLDYIISIYYADNCFFAELDNNIVGYIFCKTTNMDIGEFLEIVEIGVDIKYQKMGIGKALFEKANELVKRNNLKGIRLMANKNSNAYNWYKKLGFIQSDWIEMYKIN